MVGIPGLYFVIASDDHARFVRPDPENGLHTVAVVEFTTLSSQENDPAKDPTSETDPSDPLELQHIRFARLLASRIDEDFAIGLFDHLVLVAAPRVLRELVSWIGEPTRTSVLGSLAKDLATVPDLELWPQLLSWIQPAPISWAPSVPSHGW